MDRRLSEVFHSASCARTSPHDPLREPVRQLDLELTELALDRLGARPFRVGARPASEGAAPVRSTGVAGPATARAAIEALAASGLIVNLTVEDMLRARELRRSLPAARVC